MPVGRSLRPTDLIPTVLIPTKECPMPPALRLAVWQGHSANGDLAAAVQTLLPALRAAGAMGADCLIVPEIWLAGYNQPDIAETAMPRGSAALVRLAAACAETGCGLVVGYAEATGAGVANAALYFDTQGAEVANYRKIQLYGPREKAIYTAGDSYVVFDLAGHKAAMLICYDVEFSHHVKALADQGVEVILVPTANMVPYVHVPRLTVPAMAANHGVAIAYANYCGSEGDLVYTGGSVIVGPHGEVLAQAGDGVALLIADLPQRDPVRLSSQSADLRTL